MGIAGAALLRPLRVPVVLSNNMEFRKMKLKIASLKFSKRKGKGKSKGKFHPRTGHESPEGE
jgi:hypothetical protein